MKASMTITRFALFEGTITSGEAAEFRTAMERGEDVARLHSGDLSVWSAMGEQLRRLRAAGIPYDVTPGVPSFAAAAAALGMPTFGSPTLSDQALMSFPSVKIGPGHSGRSHTADEFIYVDELKQGIDLYIQLLTF